MRTVATWKPGMESLHHADADRVAQEILSIGETATPAQIVDKARGENTELHKCFDWNDSSAAEKYRLFQARQVVCHLVIQRSESEQEKPPVRYLHIVDTDEGRAYKATELILQVKPEYDRLLERAYAELHAFKVKYQTLSELEEIMALIP